MSAVAVAVAVAVASLTIVFTAASPPATDPGVLALAALEPLFGAWGPPADPAGGTDEPPDWIVHAYAPTVGGMAVHLREAYPPGAPEAAVLDGLIWWNPATERVEFAAVAGTDPGQGRLFRGEYRRATDGAVERIYDVFYRTAADTPGEELGGARRRFRERYTVDGDALHATLDWWHDGAWRAYGPGTYELRRRPSEPGPQAVEQP